MVAGLVWSWYEVWLLQSAEWVRRVQFGCRSLLSINRAVLFAATYWLWTPLNCCLWWAVFSCCQSSSRPAFVHIAGDINNQHLSHRGPVTTVQNTTHNPQHLGYGIPIRHMRPIQITESPAYLIQYTLRWALHLLPSQKFPPVLLQKLKVKPVMWIKAKTKMSWIYILQVTT